MSIRIDLQPAYILHTRAYRDTSLLVDALTQEYGKVSLVARGARKSKNNQRYLLQPFNPLLISWQGNHNLKTLVGVELGSSAYSLSGKCLYSALYANELLSYLLPQDDISSSVYPSYEQLLQDLMEEGAVIEPHLRCFEFHLLNELGYGINFYNDADTDLEIEREKNYFFVQQHGFVQVDTHPEIRDISFLGKDIISIGQKNFSQASTCQTAKFLSREALKPLLRGRKLKSRELFTSFVADKDSADES